MTSLIQQIKSHKTTKTIIMELGEHGVKQLPFSTNYHSPLNPCFIHQLNSIKDCASHFLIRDGIIPLIEFFINKPCPPKDFPILIIPAVARGFAPPAWIEKILFYENQSLINKPELKNLHLYLPTVSDHVLHRKEILNRLKEITNEHEFNSIQLDFIGQNQIIENEESEYQKFLFYQDLIKSLDDVISVGEKFEDYEQQNDLRHVGVFELSHPLFIYDSYLFHFFSHRSAYYFSDNEFEGGEIVKLSDHHAQVLYPPELLADEVGGMYENLVTSLKGEYVDFQSIFQKLRP